jgi:hypothetical protein
MGLYVDRPPEGRTRKGEASTCRRPSKCCRDTLVPGHESASQKQQHYLRERFQIAEGYYFIGYIPEHEALYTSLQRAGFVLQFKEVARDADGKAKGNVDVDLTLRAVDKIHEYDQALILSAHSDGFEPPTLRFACTTTSHKGHCATPSHALRGRRRHRKRVGPWAFSLGDRNGEVVGHIHARQM